MEIHYYTYKGIKRIGPYTLKELKKHKIYANSKIWKEGTEDWTTASELPEFESLIHTKPPPLIKPLSYFNKTLKFRAAIAVTIIVYLFVALFINEGLKTIIFKFHNQDMLAPIHSTVSQRVIDTIPKGSGLSKYLEQVNKGVDSSRPKIDPVYREVQKIYDPVQSRNLDVKKYRDYIPDLDPDDPNLEMRLTLTLDSIISNAFYGFTTILITLITFVIAVVLTNLRHKA
jgi:hypothetical protein